MKDLAPLIERAFDFVPREQSYEVVEVDGRIPEFVRGTYYLNGPARFSRADVRYRHWLDGDGMVCSLRFDPEGVRFTNRFVRSAKLSVEEEAGRAVFRAFGTRFPSDRLKRGLMLEPPVNVSVYPYAGSLLAFGEQGMPLELHPDTLETIGYFDFHGALNDISPFAAHPKIDPESGELFNFGVAFSAREPYLNFYRFDADAALIFRKRLALPYPCSVHDFGLSRSHAVFYLSPYLLDMKSFVQDGLTLMESLRWEPERGSCLLVVARDTGELRATLPVGSRYCLHFINCFELDGVLNVDLIELDRPVYDQYQDVPDLFTDVCEGRPVRFLIDVDGSELLKTIEMDYRLAPDFPSVDPKLSAVHYDDFWMLGISRTGRTGRKFFDQLVHARWSEPNALDIYQAPSLHYLGGEPVFIGGRSEGAKGLVLCQIFDAERAKSSFALFDASNVARGPIVLLSLKEPVHLGFHASFDSSRAN